MTEPRHSSLAIVVLAGTCLIGLLSPFAFHPGYLAVEKATLPWFVHAHTALMIVWMGMLLTQSYAILKKKYRQHRLVGRWSYAVMPALIGLAAIMMQYSFDIVASPSYQPDVTKEGVDEALASMALPFYYFVGLLLFYALAILNRKDPFRHGQYMVVTMLMLTGPVFDRVLYIYMPDAGILWEGVAFATMDLVFLWILRYSLLHKLSYSPALMALSYFVFGQTGYFFARESEVWLSFASFLFQ